MILPAIVTVDKKEGRPFVLAQDRRTIFELGADSQGAMELEVDDPNNGKGKHRCLEYNSDDHSSVSCRLVVEAAKSMMPIADLAFTTSEDLYAVTTDVRDASAQSTSTVKLCYFTECTRYVGPAS